MYKKIINASKNLIQKIQQPRSSEPVISSHDILQAYMSDHTTPPTIQSEISLLSAIKIIAVVIGVFLLWQFVQQTSDILMHLFFALFVASVLYPSISFLERYHIPRAIAILCVFSLVFLFLAVLISSILPALISQTMALGDWTVSYLRPIYNGDFSRMPWVLQPMGVHLQDFLQNVDSYVRSLTNNQETQQGLFQLISDNISKIEPWRQGLTSAISSIFSFFSSLFLVVIMAFFILFEREVIIKFILSFFSPRLTEYIVCKGKQMQSKISGWIHGQMILFLVMGGVTWIFFSIIGVEYAMTVGFLAGAAEFLPYLGVMITVAVGAPLAFGQGIEIGLISLVFFACMQFIEGNILIPLVMEKAVGVSALTTILAMLIGFHFLGIIGAIMAIPMASIISIFIQDVQKDSVSNMPEMPLEQTKKSLKK